jgi:hypothetical protein
MWLVLLIVVLVVLAVMFGGFQKGTKSGSLGPARTANSALAGGLEAGVDGLGLQRENGEDAFVHAP